MKSLLFLFLCIATCLESIIAAEVQQARVASVLENTTSLHKCNAFFVTKRCKKRGSKGKILITTASCVLSPRRQIFVGVGDNLIGQGVLYNVSEIFIHPNYTKNPELYNIAIVHIDKPAKDVFVYKLLNTTHLYGLTGTLYLRRFVDRKFELTENDVVYVTKDLYKKATNLRLLENELAVMSRNPISTGSFDVGMPFTVEFSDRYTRNSGKKQKYVLGFLVKRNLKSKGKFFELYSMSFYYSWIAEHLNCDYSF